MAPPRDQWSGFEHERAAAPKPEKTTPETPRPAPKPQSAAERRGGQPEALRAITRGVQEKEFGKLQDARAKMRRDEPMRLVLSDAEIALAKRVMEEAIKDAPGLQTEFMHEGIDLKAENLIAAGKQSPLKRIFENRASPIYQSMLRGLEEGRDPKQVVAAVAESAERSLRAAREKARAEREKAEREAERSRQATKDEPPPSTKTGLFSRFFGGK